MTFTPSTFSHHSGDNNGFGVGANPGSPEIPVLSFGVFCNRFLIAKLTMRAYHFTLWERERADRWLTNLIISAVLIPLPDTYHLQ